MEPIANAIKNLIACYLILRAVIEMVPEEKYRKYVRLFGGLLLIVCVMNQMPFGLHNINTFSQNLWKKTMEEKLNEQTENKVTADKCASYGVLSTIEEEVKTKLNKLNFGNNYGIKCLKLGVCEDVDSVDYGELTDVYVIVSKNVDKTANISVNKIIVRQMKQTDSENKIKSMISKELQIPEDVITVTVES